MNRKRLGVFGSLLTIAFIVGLFASPATSQAVGAAIQVTPNTVPQDSDVSIKLTGFRPNEIVTIWQTLPDDSVIGHGNHEVDENGNATVAWYVKPSYPTGLHAMSARGNRSRRIATTHFRVTLGEGMSSNVHMSVSSVANEQGTSFKFSAVGFGSHEAVSVWLRTPADSLTPLGQIMSSDEGVFDYELTLGGEASEGTYHLTAYGNESHNRAIATFELKRGDTLQRAVSSPKVIVTPKVARQSTLVAIEGQSFGSRETIAVWITLPDARAIGLFEIQTEQDGFFATDIMLPEELTTGTHYVTAFGKSSGLRAVTELEVIRRGP
jgi:hypothetical protein